MRPPVLCALIAACWALGAGAAFVGAAAAEQGVPAELHPWGRFRPGAWKQYRVVTETFDEHGKVVDTSTTYTTTTLKPSEQRKIIALTVEAIVEMAGKQIEAQPSIVKQGLHGETAGEKTDVVELEAQTIEVAGRQVPCRVEQVEAVGEAGKTITKTWFSAALAPYVLRRESRTLDRDGATVLQETRLTVLALRVRCESLPDLGEAAQVEIVSSHAKGKTVTKAITSPEIPGGVVCHTAEEFDADGRLVRRSTLTLLDYGLTPKKDHSGLFNRIRSRGHRPPRATPKAPDRGAGT